MVPNQVPLSPLSFLDRAAEVFPTKIAAHRPAAEPVTYADLWDRALRLAAALTALGVGKGDRVAVLAPNDVELLEAHYGIPAAGAAIVALNVRLAPQEYEHILRHAGCRVLIVDRSLREQVEGVGDHVEELETIVEIGSGQGSAAETDYDDWLARTSPTRARLGLPDHEDDPIAVNYTSGTTGSPKGVVYTHRGAYLNAMGQALQFGLSPGSVYLWTLPMFHCNGWCYTWAVTAVGGTHVCARSFDASAALEDIERFGVTHLCGAPIVLSSLAEAGVDQAQPFTHEVRAATGGAPPSPAVLARMKTLGVEVVHLYGLTETYGPSLVCEVQPAWDALDDEQLAEKQSRQGVRTINVQDVRVVDGSLEDVPSDGEVVGEIVVRSNTVMAGYLDDPEATAAAFHGGWFRTGDLAVRHPDGYVEIRDRAKDIIISGGENVSSIEVENVIAEHPDVLEVAVVAASHAKWGEVPVAYVTLRGGSQLTEDEVIAHVRKRLAGFKTPKAVVFGDLPRTSTGKIRKNELRDLTTPLS